jgi:hypothetical protein
VQRGLGGLPLGLGGCVVTHGRRKDLGAGRCSASADPAGLGCGVAGQVR